VVLRAREERRLQPGSERKAGEARAGLRQGVQADSSGSGLLAENSNRRSDGGREQPVAILRRLALVAVEHRRDRRRGGLGKRATALPAQTENRSRRRSTW
jgi:hypothetical protein